MIMASRAVHVPVREFFIRSLADFHYLDIEVELDTCKRVIGINCYCVKTDFNDRYNGTATG